MVHRLHRLREIEFSLTVVFLKYSADLYLIINSHPMKNIKSKILNLLSSTPICVEELFDLNFKSDLIFKAINQLEAEGAVLVQKGEMAYIKLAS